MSLLSGVVDRWRREEFKRIKMGFVRAHALPYVGKTIRGHVFSDQYVRARERLFARPRLLIEAFVTVTLW